MRAYERLLKYVQYETTSCETNPNCPSSEGQWVLANALAEEMKALGMEDVRVDEHCYVYGFVSANVEGADTIGLIAHMDTSDSVPASPMHTKIIPDFDGKPVRLEGGDYLDPEVFPAVKTAIGKDLIVTDGKTLLGADDKAGVAEILTAVETILTHPEIKHGRIAVGFTPDEEIGRGANLFNVKAFGADYAYTVDGGDISAYEYENFNAASGVVHIHGLNVHPGSAKDIMKNAALMATEFASMLPREQTPANTEGYEGFFHLLSIRGDEEHAELQYIIRDHDAQKFETKKKLFAQIGEVMNTRYGAGTFDVVVTDSYQNMKSMLEDKMYIIERAEKAIAKAGLKPHSCAIRGGTDGARLTYMGLPCPNLGTGGMNMHGRFECVAIQDMDVMTEVLVHLLTIGE